MIKRFFMILVLTLLSSLSGHGLLAATEIELLPSERIILKINQGMTIEQIMQRVYPNDRELWPRIKAKLIEINPFSFVQYSDRLIPGQRLKLVDIKRIYEIDEPEPLNKIGFVVGLGGKATATDSYGRAQQLLINSQVFEGDRIETGDDSSLEILMDDGAEVFLKQDSVLKISEYVITENYDEGSSSILDLLRGGLRKITGAIGASATANYQVQTGLATIGIRGTDYVLKLCRLDDCTQTVSRNDPQAKLHAAVLEGAITLTNDDEVQILMALGEYGTATPQSMIVEDEKPVPSGFLDPVEKNKFDNTLPQIEKREQQQSSNAWLWVLGILLLGAGL